MDDLNLIESGDFALNSGYPYGLPSLIPSSEAERLISFDPRCGPNHCPNDIDDLQAVPAIHIHAFYPALLPEYLDILSRSIRAADLYITTSSALDQCRINRCLDDHPWSVSQRRRVLVVDNTGRNIGPLFRDIFPLIRDYPCALHLHTKASTESNLGGPWREHLMSTLLPENFCGHRIVSHFASHSNLGLLIPQTPSFMRVYQNWGDNYDAAMLLSNQLWPDRRLTIDAPLTFPVGMMFWFRPQAILALSEFLGNSFQWPFEPIAWDGTCLHAIERLICHSVEAAEYCWQTIRADKNNQAAGTADSTNASTLPEDYQCLLSVWQSRPLQYQALLGQLANSYRQTLERLEALQTQAQDQICASEQLLAKRDQEILTLRSSYQDLQESSLIMIDEVQKHQAQIELVHAQSINAIHNSFSWKVTKPIRVLSRLLRASHLKMLTCLKVIQKS